MLCAADTAAYLADIRSPLAVAACAHVADGVYGGYALLGRVAARPSSSDVESALQARIQAHARASAA